MQALKTHPRWLYLVPVHKRRLPPDFGVGQWIQLLEIYGIFLRVESIARLELGRDSPFLDRHYLRSS
jgi:hypothetical protein